MATEQKPLIVILGPTASGKTALSIKVAKKINGEIICADSRTVYRYMDVGTAKTTKGEQAQIPHWGLDLVDPGDYFSVADFKKYADKKIEEIRKRGKVPMLVGGTGLYIDSVIFDYKFGDAVDLDKRLKLQQLTIQELQEYCIKNNIELPENSKNKRYLVRVIENDGVLKRKAPKPINNCIIVGITTEKSALLDNISWRIDKMLEQGVVQEYINLVDRFGSDNEALKSNAYLLIKKFINKEINLDDVKNTLSHLDWRLAKRQMTWFKRNPFINWFNLDEAEDFIIKKMSPR